MPKPTPTTVPFDPQHPYRLTEDNDTRLRRVRSTLTVLADFSSFNAKFGVGIDLSPFALEEMFWMLQNELNEVIDSYMLDSSERRQA